MKKLFILIAFLAAYAGSAFAQNSVSWRQDGKRFSINIYTGDFSITWSDNEGNTFTIYGQDYDFEVSASGGIQYYTCGGPREGKVSKVGSTSIDYYTCGGPREGKVSNVGSTIIDYYTCGGPREGKVSNVGSTIIDYYTCGGPKEGKVSSISGNVK